MNNSAIQWIQMCQNFLSGMIPHCFGIQQKNLLVLNLAQNQLEGTNNSDSSFLSSLTDCSHLKLLDVSRNKLNGQLPDLIGNLSRNMFYLNVEMNRMERYQKALGT